MIYTLAAKTNIYGHLSKDETYNGIKNAGFKYMEISASPGSNSGFDRFTSFTDIANIQKQIEELGLVPIALGGHTNIMDLDLFDDFVNNLKLAKFLGCKYFVSSIGAEKGTDVKIIVEQINKLLPYFEKYDLFLAIELHGNYAIGSEIKEIIKLCNSKRIFINYDTANAIHSGGLTPEEMVKDFENSVEYIGSIHLKDKLGKQDEWNFPALGRGYIPFKDIFDILEKHQVNPYLVIEIEYTKDGVKTAKEADEALISSKKYLDTLIKYD